MYLQLAEEMGEIRRQVANLLQVGTIVSESEDSRYYKVAIGSIEEDIPRASPQPKSKVPLSIGDIVVMLCPHGDLKRAIIVGAISKPTDVEKTSDYFYKLPNDGELRYTSAGDVTLNLGKGSKLTITTDAEITIKGATIKLDGDLKVTGKVTADGEVTGSDIKTASGISLETHTHKESNSQQGTAPPTKVGV